MSPRRTQTVLFLCSQNRLCSPTAEQVFARRQNLEVDSAGTNHDADNPLTAELVAWADVIFVLERPIAASCSGASGRLSVAGAYLLRNTGQLRLNAARIGPGTGDQGEPPSACDASAARAKA
ncbi:hypothetical protein [Sphingomonas sp. Leaf339]|uniref:hypothetical protein n=1 Tax=Sphingomonas sp. Leaf339 TaxID=1736343 RepID=UPI001F16E09E|nr:hypothetical protein [Sphingomonas sp. Leaf339]